MNSFPGTITTPRYPLPYPNNRICLWEIVAPEGHYINIAFRELYVLEYECAYSECECKDTLEITDGGKPLPHRPHHGYVRTELLKYKKCENNE